jgi:hypothetical protein
MPQTLAKRKEKKADTLAIKEKKIVVIKLETKIVYFSNNSFITAAMN